MAQDELFGCHLGMVDLVTLVGCTCRNHLIHGHGTARVKGGVGAPSGLHGHRCRAAGKNV